VRRFSLGEHLKPAFYVAAFELREGIDFGEVRLEKSNEANDAISIVPEGGSTQRGASDVQVVFEILMKGVVRIRKRLREYLPRLSRTPIRKVFRTDEARGSAL
jgi:hypothetical protein